MLHDNQWCNTTLRKPSTAIIQESCKISRVCEHLTALISSSTLFAARIFHLPTDNVSQLTNSIECSRLAWLRRQLRGLVAILPDLCLDVAAYRMHGPCNTTKYFPLEIIDKILRVNLPLCDDSPYLRLEPANVVVAVDVAPSIFAVVVVDSRLDECDLLS